MGLEARYRALDEEILSMRFGLNPQTASARILRLAIGAALLLLCVYAVIYWYQPFSEVVNNFFSNFFTELASLFAAVLATLIWKRYDKEDAPKRVWSNFAVGLWLWFAGEVAWGYINLTRGEVPVGVQDVFWIISYFFFGRALLSQYKILKQPNSRQVLNRVLIAIFCLLALVFLVFTLLISNSEPMNNVDALVNAFYPAVDVLLSAIAIWLARNFAGGAFARPWLGLLAFSVSDLLYAWLDQSGFYAWSVAQGNLLSTISDVAYLAAYLVLGLGVLSQWLFLKYGLRSSAEPL